MDTKNHPYHALYQQVNGQLVLEGVLLIHWRVQSYIRLAEKDESRASRENWRHSYTMAMHNGLDEDLLRVRILIHSWIELCA